MMEMMKGKMGGGMGSKMKQMGDEKEMRSKP